MYFFNKISTKLIEIDIHISIIHHVLYTQKFSLNLDFFKLYEFLSTNIFATDSIFDIYLKVEQH